MNCFDDHDFTKYTWIHKSFIDVEDQFELKSNEKEILTELASDNSLKSSKLNF